MKFTVFPQFSKNRVNQAGEAVRKGNHNLDDELVIENWRASHSYILNTFQATLRRHVKDNPITIAQRLKRRNTIFDKLSRQPKMNLARMHDLAGCRLIFENETQLNEYRNKIHNSKFKHILKNNFLDYDYIQNPKHNGYRGIHDVYSYVAYSPQAKNWNGLLLELQYRTKVQHAWATAVEISGSLTGNEPKFDRGNRLHQEYFTIASELLAREYEGHTSVLQSASDQELVKRIVEIDGNINLSSILRNMHVSAVHFKNSKNLILKISGNNKLEIMGFTKTARALEVYKTLELSSDSGDVVLVRADSHEAIRSAFRNYFSDAKDFLNYLERAKNNLK